MQPLKVDFLLFDNGLEALPLGSSGEFPVLRENSLQIQPGREHDLNLGAQVGIITSFLGIFISNPTIHPYCPQVVTSDSILSLPPEARRCYFPHEGGLQYYSHYTLNNCRYTLSSKYQF